MVPRPLRLAVLSMLLCACARPEPVRQPVPLPPVPQPVQQPSGIVERALRAAAGGGEIPADLLVRYSDVHGLHGGTTISLTANGAVESRTVDPRSGLSERRGTIPPDSVRAVIGLLVELAAWEQRTPPRRPVPDESAAGLTIRAGGQEVSTWEWYNEMAANARLVRVLGRLRSFATVDPAAPPPPPPG